MLNRDIIKTIIKVFAVTLIVLTLSSCGSEFDLPQQIHGPEALIFVANDGNGTISIIEHSDIHGNMVSKTIHVGSGGIGDMVVTTEDHIFVNVTDNNAVAAIDPIVDGPPELRNFLPAGSRPVHAYRDPEGTRVWVMNDGGATSGTCKTAGPGGTATSSVTLIQNHEVDGGGGDGGQGTLGEVIATICVGRGHHKAAFSFPTSDTPAVPNRTFVSNISDGTISVIDNDPASSNYLKVVSTIDLCDSAKETALGNPACDMELSTPNKSGPHGIDYSPVSGKIYNANTGYGTMVVIDPTTFNAVDATIDIGFSNKAHVSPDGRFLIVKGTDTKSDTNHVFGKLTVIDVVDNSFKQTDIPDLHPNSFEFTPDGEKLYVASATSGSEAQKANLKNNVVLVYDTSALPILTLIKEIPVGVADSSHRGIAIHEHDGTAEHVIVPNPAEDTVSFIDPETDTVVDTVTVGDEPGSILVFPVGESHTHR